MSDKMQLRVVRPERLLRDRVTDVLRAAVLEGVFSPGDRLTERQLVERTGVSRTSLREGLRQLQAEGLVEPAPGRGLRVTLLTEPELAELYEVRLYLESAAVELFVDNASDKQRAGLARHLFESGEGANGKFDPWSSYYDKLFDGANNTLLRKLYGSIAARIVMMQNLSVGFPGRVAESQHEIEDVLMWIEKRDAARASEAAKHHVRMAKEAALRALRSKTQEAG